MKILAFGEVMMRLMPSNYKQLNQVDTLEYLFSGTGVNILSGLYQMGEEVYLLSSLPDNSVGNAATAHLRKLGINDDYLVYKGNHIGIYILESGIGARASKVTYLNRKDSSFGHSKLSDYDFSCLDDKDALHICGISLASNQNIRETVLALAIEAKKRNIKIIFDCNFRSSLWSNDERDKVKSLYEEILMLADIVFAGYKDATLLLGLTVDNTLDQLTQSELVLKQMCLKYGLEVIFGTNRTYHDNQSFIQGYQATKDSFKYSQEYQLTIYDRIGGGDGFAAGAIYGYLNNYKCKELLQYATLSGVLAHTTYGDSPIVTKEEIWDVIRNGVTEIKR